MLGSGEAWSEHQRLIMCSRGPVFYEEVGRISKWYIE